MHELTDMESRFIEEYLRDRNATQAAIRAGHSKTTAPNKGFAYMRDPKILEVIERRKQEVSDELRGKFIFDASEARDIMVKIMRDERTMTKYRITIAKDILDRAGFKGVEEVKVSGKISNPFSSLSIDELKRLAGVEYDDNQTRRTV